MILIVVYIFWNNTLYPLTRWNLFINVDPEKITWIISNDCWYLNRDVYDMANLWDGMKRQCQTILRAKDINDVYRKYEKDGILFRIDEKIWPAKMRVGTITY